MVTPRKDLSVKAAMFGIAAVVTFLQGAQTLLDGLSQSSSSDFFFVVFGFHGALKPSWLFIVAGFVDKAIYLAPSSSWNEETGGMLTLICPILATSAAKKIWCHPFVFALCF